MDPKTPKWFNRDRFVLSAGHGSMLNYSLLHLMGYESVGVSCTGIVGAPTLWLPPPQRAPAPVPLRSLC